MCHGPGLGIRASVLLAILWPWKKLPGSYSDVLAALHNVQGPAVVKESASHWCWVPGPHLSLGSHLSLQ